MVTTVCERVGRRPDWVCRQSWWRTSAKLRRPQSTTIDLDDIRASHLHPRDVGVITSVDQPVDPAAWRWGGPGWQDRAVPGRVESVEVAGADPQVWARLLDRPIVDGVLTFDDGTSICFVDGPAGVGVVDLTVDGTSVRIG